MEAKTVKRINILSLTAVIIIIFAAVLLRKQVVSYDLIGTADTSISLSRGETVVQTYSPNRRNITEFEFALAEECAISGNYTLVVTDKESIDGEPIFRITNTYNGESVKALIFVLPKKYNPAPGVRLNLFVSSDTANTEGIELSAGTSYRSAYILDDKTSKKTLSDSTLDVTIVSEKNYKWFVILYILLLTFGITFILMHFFKSGFEENLALSIMFSVFFAYILGLIRLFNTVPIILFIVSAGGIVLFFWDCTKKQEPFYKCITNSMILWGVVVLVLFITIHHTYIGDPDTVFYMNKGKYMFWTDSLAHSPGYFFFIPVFAHFFEITNGIFSEDLFLLAIIVYEFSIMFTFINIVEINDRKRDLFSKMLILALCSLLSIAVHPGAFFTAMMDVPFAMTIAYALRNIYSKEMTKEHILKMLSGALTLVMIKRAGLPTVLIFAMILIVHAIRYRKEGTKVDRRYLLVMIVLVLFCFAANETVSFYASRLDDKAVLENLENISLSVTSQDNQAVGQFEKQSFITHFIEKYINGIDVFVIKRLFAAFLFTDIYMGMSYAENLAVIFLIAALAWLIKKDKASSEFLLNMTELTVAAFLYFGVISYKYIYSIEEYNKYKLNAYDRYAIHFIGAVMIIEVICLIKLIHNKDENQYGGLVVLTVVLMLVTCLRTDYRAINDQVDADVESIEEYREEFERVLTIFSGYGHNLAVYMPHELFDQASYYTKRIDLECWPSGVAYNTNILSSETEIEIYTKYLYDTSEYLYLVNYDEYFLDCAPNLLTDAGQEILRHALYYVDKEADGLVRLEYLGQVPFNDLILRTPDGNERLDGN